MHARIIPLIRDFEISFSGLCAAVKSSGRTDLEINNFCLTRKFPSLTAPRTTKVPEPQDVDLSELIKTSLLVAKFPPLPNLNLILREAENQQNFSPSTPLIDPTSMNARDQRAATEKERTSKPRFNR